MLLTSFAWESVLETYRREVQSPAELQSDKTRRLFDWWTRHAESGLPLRRAFDITEHRDLASQISLIDVVGDGSFQARILGSKLQWWVDEDRTRRPITMMSQLDNDRFLRTLYASVVATRRPWLNGGRLRLTSGREVAFEGIDCPLSSDGVTITGLIGVLDFL